MKGMKPFYFVLAICALLVLPSCGGGGGDSGGGGGGAVSTPQTGTLSVGLTDASTDAYKAVYVTISEIQVHMSGDVWKVIGAPNKTYNLLDLVNGVREELGITELNAGDYTQMRLIIGETPDGGINILSKQHPFANYVIDLDDKEHELKVPSGFETGVKIVQGFTINASQTTELILDFSASESVVVAGKSGKWLLKPTIKVLNTQEYSIISGRVDDSVGKPLPGVLVSAQISDTSAPDPTDQVVTEASTVTDEDGLYNLFIKPGTYTMVAYSSGYSPDVVCAVSLIAGQVAEGRDFVLTPASTGSVSGVVSIENAVEDQYATISLRQSVDCNGDGTAETAIEVSSVNVLNGGPYSVTLPVGLYELVAFSYGKTTQSFEVEVFQNTDTSAPVDLL
jgi:hypothetical protein